jgi:hypothetical protein
LQDPIYAGEPLYTLTMKAFISYSHQDSAMLDHLHTHLSQLKREQLISTWTDRQIDAGGRVDDQIGAALKDAQIFIALLSPHYIASGYCYEKEFATALEREKAGTITIVPVIVQPCDWHNTPFTDFKALPRDGKAVSDWSNVNTAFLDVTQNLRKMVAGQSSEGATMALPVRKPGTLSRNYKVRTDFDSIHKMEFVAKTFREVKDYIKLSLAEVETIDNIKTMPGVNTDSTFEYLLVNRNKINAEAKLALTTEQDSTGFSVLRSGNNQLSYSIGDMNRSGQLKSFALAWDDFHLYWTVGPMGAFYGRSRSTELTAKDIAELIFNEWLTAVGIL